ncbi:MAG: diol dehydratase small subunit [Synergistaceae bacterium]|jgi:propanediol dehydratase small subunit|nr:diol dehydratase small subunit [Synergistaceae bacterium]
MTQVNEQLIADVVRQVLNSVNGNGGSSPASFGSSSGISAADYPLGVKRKDLLKSPRGIPFDELSLENVESGKVGFEDFRISPEVLKLQGEIASSAGRSQIALNLGRAGELTKVPDVRILEIYNSLRPHRSTKEELLSIADELQSKFGAKVTADFVREAADVYQRRKLLKGDLVSTD